jgi:hypothetical protein
MCKLCDDKVDRLVEQVANVMRPVLYPVEQQDCAIQAEHDEAVKYAARVAVETWLDLVGNGTKHYA